MMDFRAIKAPKRKLDWKGSKVRATREVLTGSLVIPPGKLGTIQYSANGDTMIHSDVCLCCGLAGRLIWKHLRAPDSFEFVEPVQQDLLTGVRK